MNTTVDVVAFEHALTKFIAAAQAKVDARFADSLPDMPPYMPPSQGIKLEAEINRKYVRVVEHQIYDGVQRKGGSVYCFIDRTNGNVLKAASWAAPEKRNVRSNIFAPDHGASGVDGYGAVYLR